MSEKSISKGFFCMDDAIHISSMPDIAEAKQFALDKIQSYIEQHPGTKPANIQKATRMVTGSRGINQLVMTITSLILAHPSEGLRVIK